MKNNQDNCEVRLDGQKKCSRIAAIGYYNNDVCTQHWNEHCDGKIDLKKIFGIVPIGTTKPNAKGEIIEIQTKLGIQ